MRKTLFAATLAACFATAAFAADPQPAAKGSCCSAKDTAGWEMMSPDERRMHQDKMGGFKDMGSCQAYMKEHHKSMEARAKQKGMKPPHDSGHGCDSMKK
jgi:opacity protein-like surface antigen